MKNITISLLILIISVSCSTMSKEDAMEYIQGKSIYNSYFYAPIHIGKQVITLENEAKLQDYINERYGLLIKEGLLDVEIQKESTWRNVFNVKLTEKSSKLIDFRRGDEEHVFVPVCKILPVSIDTLIPLDNGTMECRYQIEQKELTSFGRFLGYESGKRFPIIDTISK